MLSKEAPWCAARSRRRRGNVLSMQRLYPGKAGQKHTQRRELPMFILKKTHKQNHLFVTCYKYFVRYSRNLLQFVFILIVLQRKYIVNIKNAKEVAMVLDVYNVIGRGQK